MSNKLDSKTLLIILIALLTVYAATIATINLTSTKKIAFIDSAVLMTKYSGAITAREELTKKSEEWQQNVKTLETELNELNKEILEQSAKWSKKTLAEKQEAFKKKQGEYYRYHKAVNDKAAALEKEQFEPVYAELNARIADYAKAEGLDLILGTVAGGNILYGGDAVDLTEEFLEYVDGGEE